MSAPTAAAINEPLDAFLFTFPSAPPLWVIALGMLLILLVVVRARWRRAGAPDVAPAGPEQGALPHAAALEVFDSVDGDWPADEREFDAFCVLLSLVVRRYVQHRFGVRALESATDEILDSFRARDLPAAQFDSLRSILHRCDGVKFAVDIRREVARDARHSAAALLTKARDFVNATAPRGGGAP